MEVNTALYAPITKRDHRVAGIERTPLGFQDREYAHDALGLASVCLGFREIRLFQFLLQELLLCRQ